MARVSTREDDAVVLEWVKRRSAGETCAAIGIDYGTSGQHVSTATNRVMRQDAATGEDVAEAYW